MDKAFWLNQAASETIVVMWMLTFEAKERDSFVRSRIA